MKIYRIVKSVRVVYFQKKHKNIIRTLSLLLFSSIYEKNVSNQSEATSAFCMF